MANTELLKSIATLLPDNHRERFLMMAARFKTVPNDDEYLQILESIGFMTLIWNEMPNRLAEILGEAQEVRHELSAEQARQLGTSLTESLTKATELPSYQDLRKIAHEMREQQQMLQGALSRCTEPALTQTRSCWGSMLVAVVVGIVAGLGGLCLGHCHLQRRYDDHVAGITSSIPEAERLVRSMAASPSTHIQFFDGIDDSLDRPVRALVLNGPIIDAFKDDAGRGVVRLEASRTR